MAGIFSLSDVRQRQIKNIVEEKVNNIPEYINYGYFGGGIPNNSSPFLCTIDRLDFSTETVSSPAVSPGQLTLARYGLATVSSSSYGYFGGGFAVSYTNTIDRIDFSNETVIDSGKRLTETKLNLTGVSSGSYGYFAGGTTGPTYACTLNRLDFSTEIISTPTSILTQAREQLATVSSSSYGYFGGGFTPFSTPTSVCTIDRIDFSTEVISAPGKSPGQLSTIRIALSGVSNASYGYFGGGTSSSPVVNTIDRLDFSTETTSAPGKNLITARKGLASVSSSSYGYFGGGNTTPPTTSSNTVDRLDFSTEATSAPGKNLITVRELLAATSERPGIKTLVRNDFANFSESATYGYFGGGYNGTLSPSRLCTLDRIEFATETTSAPGKNLSRNRSEVASVFNNFYGYFVGGDSPPSTCTVDRIDFSTEIVSNPGKNLTRARFSHEAVSSSLYGYLTGGSGGCIIDRLDFSNETSSEPGNAFLSVNRSRFASTSSEYYGYFTGNDGAPGSPDQSTFDRLDFSTEISSRQSYFLPTPRRFFVGSSTNNYGYFGCGDGFSTLERLDFSTETILLSQNIFTVARRDPAAVSSNSYGYYSGGVSGSTRSSIDRLNYFTETISVLPTAGNLTQARFTHTGVSGGQSQRVLRGRTTGTYGYIAHGSTDTPPATCIIERLDFSTETTFEPGTTTPAGSIGVSAVSNNLYGYFVGFAFGATISRLDFGTESVSLPGKNQSIARAYTGSLYTNSYGYFAGGLPTPPGLAFSTLERLDFSNETLFTLPSTSNLNTAGYYFGNVQSNNYGYFGGNFSTVSNIQRFDFSSEVSSTISNLLSRNASRISGIFNSSYGYFAGGVSSCIIDRLDFSNDTVYTPGKNLLTNVSVAAKINSNTYGYIVSGNRTPIATETCTITRLDFYTETVSDSSNSLKRARQEAVAVSTEQRASTVNKGFSSFTATYGYFAGSEAPGSPPIVTSTIERLDFYNQTVSLPGNNLTQGRGRLAATSSASYGYFGGGTSASFARNTIDRIEFSTETTSAPGKNLIKANDYITAFSSSSYGYFGSGFQYRTSFERLDFSNETTSEPGKSLTLGKYNSVSISNSSYGYNVGGHPSSGPPPATSSIERLDFSTETYSVPGYNLPDTRSDSAAVGSNSYGYFGAGSVATGPLSSIATCTIDRLDFSTEVASRLKSTLPQRSDLAATTSASYGYFGGGSPPASSPTISRFDIFNETFSATGKTLSVAGSGIAAVSSAYKPPIRNGWGWRKTYGYFGGGYVAGSPIVCTIDRLDFSTEILSRVATASFPTGLNSLAATSSSSYAYFGGGVDGVIYRNTIARLDFSTETRLFPGKNLTQSRIRLATVSSGSYGYFGGGLQPSPNTQVCTIDRLDFSTEVIIAPATSPGQLTSARSELSGVFNASYGYFGGGNISVNSAVNTIDRLDFSTDVIAVPSPGKNLTQPRYGLGSVSSGSYGYFAGGNPPLVNTIDRIDFSTETISAPGKNLTQSRQELAAVSSGSYGYFGGGSIVPSSTLVTTIDRIDFSTETTTLSTQKLNVQIRSMSGIQAN